MVAEVVDTTASAVEQVQPSDADTQANSDDALLTGAAETLGDTGETEDSTQVTEEYDFEALQAQLDQGEEPLTSAQKKALGAHHQSARDQERAKELQAQDQAQRRTQVQQAQQQLVQLGQTFGNRVLGVFDQEMQAAEAEGRQPSKTLMTSLLNQEIDGVWQYLEPLALVRWDHTVKDAIKAAGGDISGLEGAPFAQVLQAWGQALHEKGGKESAEVKNAAKLTTENAKLKKEIETLTGGRGKGTGTSTEGGSGPKGTLTWAQVSKMTPAQVEALDPDEYRAAMART